MNQQDWNGDLRGRRNWADGIDLKVTVAFRKLERARDHPTCKEKRRSFGRHRPEIGERLGCDDCSHSWIVGCGLQRDCGPKRRTQQHDRAGVNRVEDAVEILFLEEAVRADVTARVTVRAAVVRDNVEPEGAEALNRADAADAIVRDTMKEDERAATMS